MDTINNENDFSKINERLKFGEVEDLNQRI